MIKLAPIILLFFGYTSVAQNLVLNPSFEEHKDSRCIVFLGCFNQTIKDWSTPNYGSTDVFRICSKTYGEFNYNGHQKPKTGATYAGMYLFTDNNYREYVQGSLSKTLTKGETYNVEFYLSLADQSSYALKDIQILFTEDKLEPCYNSNSCEKVIKPSKATKKNFKIYNNSKVQFFSDKENWTKFQLQFVANGYENYFSIGNFYKNNKTTKKQVLSTSPYSFSYYYIDAINIELLQKETPIIVPKAEEKIRLEKDKTYTFNLVLFEFDKSQLLEDSIEELDRLFRYLEANNDLKVEIYGHTDNVGTANRNKELSLNRAKAVSEYLILQGLNPNRIKWFGYGSSKPVSENKTEEGRSGNRRVEFQLINK